MPRSTPMRALIVALAVAGLANLAMAQDCPPGTPDCGRCKDFQSTAQIRTRVNGTELQGLGLAAPMGPGQFSGPRLEFLGDRTAFSNGAFCAEPADNPILAGIGPSAYQEVRIGALADASTAGGDFFFKVYNQADQPTDCVVKLTINGKDAEMTPEPQCADALPGLKVFHAEKNCAKGSKYPGCATGVENPTPINAFSIFFEDAPIGVAGPGAAPVPAPVPVPGAAPVPAPAAPTPAPAKGPLPAVIKPVVVPAGGAPAPAPEPAPSAAAARTLGAAAAVAALAAALL